MSNEAWYVSAKPWKECPFSCQLVVVTKNGQQEAIRLFREWYKNEGLEPEVAVPVPVCRGEVDPDDNTLTN